MPGDEVAPPARSGPGGAQSPRGDPLERRAVGDRIADVDVAEQRDRDRTRRLQASPAARQWRVARPGPRRPSDSRPARTQPAIRPSARTRTSSATHRADLAGAIAACRCVARAMHAFAALLDSLIYTRGAQRQAEADRRLPARHARSRPRLGDGGADRRPRPARRQADADPRADRGAGRSGAVPDEPRLCRRHRRDRGAALARARRAGRLRAADALRGGRRARATCRARTRRRCSRACSTGSTRRSGSRCSRWRPARCASASPPASPRPRWRRRSASTSRRWRRCGTASTPPYAALFAWVEGTAEQPTAADVPVFRPFMLAHPLEDLRVDLADYAAEWKWDGIRVQIVHVAGETRLYSRTGDDVTARLPRRGARLRRARRGRRRAAGEGRVPGREKAAAASTRSSSGSGARSVSAKMLAD